MEISKDQKKIIIIGGGLSGLSAGIFGQNNGFLTEIFEKNPVPGGLCTTWKRNGFLIDGCIHWLTGTKPNGNMRSVWNELGAFNDSDVIRENSIGAINYKGTNITFWHDLNRLENDLLKISPEDSRLIKRTVKLIKGIMKIHVPTEVPVYLMGLNDYLGVFLNVLPRLKTYLLATKTQLNDYAQKFKSPAIRFAFENIIYGDINLYSALYAYGTNAYGNGGVLKGGSSVLINNVVSKYKANNGVLRTNSKVKSIIIKDKKAVGIKLENGEEHFADYIISALDPFATLKLLPDGYDVPAYTKRVGNKNFPIPSCVLITYAIDKKEKDKLCLNNMQGFLTEEFTVGKSKLNCIKLHDYSYDDVFVKDGFSVCSVLLPQYSEDFDYWNSFINKEEYIKAKIELSNKITSLILKQYPSLTGKIKLLDVATQKTFERYVDSFKGSYQSFCFTAKGKMITCKPTVKGAENLILASQWMLTPGGLPPAMLTGKYAIQKILKKEHKNFRITKRIKNEVF